MTGYNWCLEGTMQSCVRDGHIVGHCYRSGGTIWIHHVASDSRQKGFPTYVIAHHELEMLDLRYRDGDPEALARRN